MLVIVLGIDVDTALELFRQGVCDEEELTGLKKDELQVLLKDFNRNKSWHLPRDCLIRAPHIKKLKLLHLYCRERRACGVPIRAALFDQNDLDTFERRKDDIDLFDDRESPSSPPN